MKTKGLTLDLLFLLFPLPLCPWSKFLDSFQFWLVNTYIPCKNRSGGGRWFGTAKICGFFICSYAHLLTLIVMWTFSHFSIPYIDAYNIKRKFCRFLYNFFVRVFLSQSVIIWKIGGINLSPVKSPEIYDASRHKGPQYIFSSNLLFIP